MRTRRRLFAIFLGTSLLPLLLLATFGYWAEVRQAETSLQERQDHELAGFLSGVGQSLRQLRSQFTKLTHSAPLLEYLATRESPPNAATPAVFPASLLLPEVPHDVQTEMGALLKSSSAINSVALYNNQQQPVLVARANAASLNKVEFQTRDFLANHPKPDSRAWTNLPAGVVNSPAKPSLLGAATVFTAALLSSDNQPKGSLVIEVLLDPIFDLASGIATDSDVLAVEDRTETILFHTNEAVRNQRAATALPYFASFAHKIVQTESGSGNFEDADHHTFTATYKRFADLDVFAMRASNRDRALGNARTSGGLLMIAAVALGLVGAAALTFFSMRQTRGIDRVSEGVQAMAQGDLDHRIDLRSRDNLRPLADNVDILTKQLREQIARETESQQFDSFVRLSAILTHDLKNSIEALSLTVSNMERHFENPDFRADAMKTLRSATENLTGLVTRLSNPVTTLSGEHKLPRLIDLVPMLKRVISMSGIEGVQQVETKLPASLHGVVDVERIDKVVENLLINAREAIGSNAGTITVEAGKTAEGKPFFSVSDTGVGMSRRFIEERLFKPFATTKKRGVGLGLYTCREVVRATGGSIDVSSKEGVGTTFTVVLTSAPIESKPV